MRGSNELHLTDGVVRRIVLLVAAGHGYIHVCLVAFPPIFPVLNRELGLTYTELGFLSTGVAFSLGLSQLIVGPLSDRFGRKWLLIGGLLLFSAATGVCGLVSTFWPLLFFQVLGGTGGSVMHPVALALVTDVTSTRHRGKSMAVHGAGSMLGNAFAPVTMVSLTIWVNWRFAMIAVGLLGLILTYLMARFIEVNPQAQTGYRSKSDSVEDKFYPFSIPAFVMVLILWATRAVTSRAYQAFLPTFLIMRYGLSLKHSAVFITIYWIIGALAQMVGGYLADRVNRYFFLLAAFVLTVISLAIMLFSQPSSDTIIFANFFMLGLFSFVGRPAFFSIYSEGLQKGRAGTFFSFGFAVSFTSSSLVPGIMGWITDQYSATTSFYPILALIIVSTIILPILWRMRSRVYV